MGDSKKIIAFDLDDVLCVRDSDVGGGVEKYYRCRPIKRFVDIANNCYDSGYYIIIYTARGMNIKKGNVSDIYDELYSLTKSQLESWGIKHHRLVMGKIHFDLLIDDKVVNSGEISNKNDIDNIFSKRDK